MHIMGKQNNSQGEVQGNGEKQKEKLREMAWNICENKEKWENGETIKEAQMSANVCCPTIDQC